MNKTPFEIRLELLQMAKLHYDAIYAAQLEFAKTAFQKAVEENKAIAAQWSKYLPTAYTIEDITKKADELYSFINKR